MVAEEAPASTHCSRRTRDQPDLTHCHGCAADVSGRHRLRPLPSEWRIVLLCSVCLSALRSRLICSYCLRPISSAAPAAGDFIDCGRCSARIHLRCVPREQRYLSLSNLNPAAASVFSCVDCCALPKLLSFFPKPSQNCSPQVALKVLNAPGVVNIDARTKADEPNQSDEEVALKLHLAMNGSRRILRNIPPRINGDVRVRKNNINNYSNCNAAQLCTEAENLFFDGRGTSSSGGSCEQQQRSSSTASQQEEWRSRDDRYLIKYGRRKNRYLNKYSRRKLRSADTISKNGYVLVPCSQNRSPELCRLTPDSSCLPSMVHLDSSAHVPDVSICQL